MKKEHHGMIDNRIVKENHQQGIERVKQRSEMPKGEPGKMSGKPKEHAHWKRGGSLTPRGA
jgi:hypothetical protein